MTRMTLPLALLSLLTACGTGEPAQRRADAVRAMSTAPAAAADRESLPMPPPTTDDVPTPIPMPPAALQTATFALG